MVPKPNATVRHIFSVDVEEYYQVEAFSQIIPRDDWEKFPSRVEESTDRVLEILDGYNVKGTFFVLGCLALKLPGLVKRISDAGHEIASHGYDHTMITMLTPQNFREDIRKSRRILEDIVGMRVSGYRAPTFSITENTSWAYGVLLQEGYSYSSSVFPILHDRYGWPSFGDIPKNMADGGEGEIWEVPMSVGALGPLRIPFGGGGYLRTYPMALTKALFRKIERLGRTGVVYIHPWELDPGQPEIRAPLLRRLRHRHGIAKMEEKLLDLLNTMRFGTAAQYAREISARCAQ
jgi:polysaccharide deacetylase family protein (PEP-CTERM system associated)